MSSSTQTLYRSARAGTVNAAHGLGHTLKLWWDAYWDHRARRTTVFLLSGLDDRTLQDIGMNRSEIESVVYSRPGDRFVRYHAPAR